MRRSWVQVPSRAQNILVEGHFSKVDCSASERYPTFHPTFRGSTVAARQLSSSTAIASPPETKLAAPSPPGSTDTTPVVSTRPSAASRRSSGRSVAVVRNSKPYKRYLWRTDRDSRTTVTGQPGYPRSPGMGWTLTPAAVRNWRIWEACSTTCSGMPPTITPNSMPWSRWALGSG